MHRFAEQDRNEKMESCYSSFMHYVLYYIYLKFVYLLIFSISLWLSAYKSFVFYLTIMFGSFYITRLSILVM